MTLDADLVLGLVAGACGSVDEDISFGRILFAAGRGFDRRRLSVNFGEARFTPPESVIVNKILFKEGGSEKPPEDIRTILESISDIDREVLAEWIQELRIEPEWKRVSPF